MAFDALAPDHLCVADAVARRRRIGDHSGRDLQAFDRHAQTLGRHFKQHRPRLRSGRAQHRAELRDAERTYGGPVPRAHASIRHYHIDRIEGDIQFLSQHLRQSGGGALA